MAEKGREEKVETEDLPIKNIISLKEKWYNEIFCTTFHLKVFS